MVGVWSITGRKGGGGVGDFEVRRLRRVRRRGDLRLSDGGGCRVEREAGLQDGQAGLDEGREALMVRML